MTTAEDATTAEFNEAIEKVYEVLEGTDGVERSGVDGLRGELSTAAECIGKGGSSNAVPLTMMRVLREAQLYIRSYPYLDATRLIDWLADSWEALCRGIAVALSQLRRKISSTKKNAKADPQVLESLEARRDETLEVSCAAHVGLCRIRILRSLMRSQAAAEKTQGTASYPTDGGKEV